MRIEKLRLKGFIGILKGLGLQEISIDFSGIVGLVAFAGQNGAGKSTILENLHPYNQLASREGALYRHCFRRDSEKELSFEYAGAHYRTLLKIDCDSGKSEGYIWKDGNSEVNGKISAYADYIRALLGSPTLFFSSVFCAQNSKKISDMTTGQLKGLFAEFLRLDRLAEYENTAKQCGNVLVGSVVQLESRCKHLTDTLAGKLSLQNDLTVFTAQAKDLEKRREDLKQQAWILSSRINDLKEIAAQNAVNVQRKQDLTDSLNRLNEDLQKEWQAVDRELGLLRAEYGELTTAIGLLDQVLKDRDAIMAATARETEIQLHINGLTGEIERLASEATTHQDAIHLMENARRDLRENITALDNDQELQDIKGNIAETEAKIKDQQQVIKNIDSDFHAFELESQIKALKEKTSILDLKDPACQSNTCAFITNALEAADMLPDLQRKLTALNVKRAEQKAAAREILDNLDAALKDLAAKHCRRIDEINTRKEKITAKLVEAEKAILAETRIAASRNDTLAKSRQQVADLKQELEQQKALAEKFPQLQIAESRSNDLEKRRQEVTEKGTVLRSAFAAKEAEVKQRIVETSKTIETVNASIDPEAEAKLKSTTETREDIEGNLIPSVERELQGTRDKLSRLQGELARMEETEKDLATLQADRDNLTREISEWTYLRNACSKNGLQALEIDGAAPLITGYANELLAQAFGPLFTVRLRTQDDEGREVLDIVVIMEDGSEVLLDNLSGGQKVWILMALRLAMTLLSKEKSGRNFETALFDELDGPLDPENSMNFIGMYQAFLKTGCFKMIPFISHKPECRNMADHILHFEAGKNPVWQ